MTASKTGSFFGSRVVDHKVLVVDFDVTHRNSLKNSLQRLGFHVDCVKNPLEAMAVFLSNPYSIAIIAQEFDEMAGIELFQKLKNSSPRLLGYLTLREADLELIDQANTHGLEEVWTRDQCLSRIEETFGAPKIAAAIPRPTASRKNGGMIGQSDAIQEVYETILKVADSDSTVLITGESGTGKELVARAIHQNSVRAKNPLVPVNCGAIPEDLLETELFGHVKGAFTGAIANRQGRFEVAHGGTLFLDEIGDMPASLQVKVLRVIQDRTFEPVGSTRTVEVDTRIIAATNVNLEQAVEDRRFREDLYYRLNVIPIFIPPLRERRVDIPALVCYFLEKFNHQKVKEITGISDEAMDLLMGYHWPGNVRELENLIERIVILKSVGRIDKCDLPVKFYENSPHGFQVSSSSGNQIIPASFMSQMNLPENGLDLKEVVNEFERELMMQALERTGWNKNKASELLRMNRTTLVEKLKKKGIQGPRA